MSPEDLMRTRQAELRLVIFDCDGVLVDSEPVSSRVVAAELTAEGWPMTAEDSDRLFLGMTFTDMVPMIEAQLGRKLPDDWNRTLVRRLVETLSVEAEPIPGALETLAAVTALGLPWRVASNSSHEEMDAKFARIGLAQAVARRVHSHLDVAQGKPAPDLFLAAAAAEGVAPGECIVVEDSVPGARGAAAAGMDCLGFAPNSDGAALRAAGAAIFHSMFDLPVLFAAARRRPA